MCKMVKKKSWKTEAKYLERRLAEKDAEINELKGSSKNNDKLTQEGKEEDPALKKQHGYVSTPKTLEKKDTIQGEQTSCTSSKVENSVPSDNPDNKDLDIKQEPEAKTEEDFKFQCPDCDALFNELEEGSCPRCKAELNSPEENA